MREKLLVLTILFLSFSFISFAQLVDDGYTSDIHEKHSAKAVFSKVEVPYEEEDANTFTNEFSYGDPVYGRLYWYPGLNNIYDKNGWSGDYGYFYYKEIYLNDELIVSYYEETENGGRTTLPFCMYPASDDDYRWSDGRVLSWNFEKMKVGTNELKIKLYPYEVNNKEKGELLSSGIFNFAINQASVEKASNYVFTGLKTTWSSGDDIWNEWKILVAGKSGRISTQWQDDANKWEYYIGMRKGEIETVFSDDFTKFELSADGVNIDMRRTFSSDWSKWDISDGTVKLELKTAWSSGDDRWTEWDLSGSAGSMKIKTSWSSGDDKWKEWSINDNLSGVSPELKMAAIFLAMFNACLL